jgi:hypothetical protein
MGKNTPPLPANEDAERFVLGSMLLDAERHLATVRAELQPEDFILDKHKRIFRRVLELDRDGKKVDRVTVADELHRHNELESCDGVSYLASLDDGLPRMPNVASYVEIVKKKAILRRVIFGARDLAKHAFDEPEDPASVIAAGEKFFHGLALATNNHKEETTATIPQWPEPIHDDGFHGIAGQLVRIIEPHSEADVSALLVQTLIGWGSLVGRAAFYQAESDRHHTNEFAVIVGTTAKGRKGTSWGRILHVLNATDSHWADNCQVAGLGSGEALIDAVAGEDRRALVLEGEFARLLAVVSREGSTISANLRNGWDTGTLSIHTRQNKVKVSGAHLSLIGHISREELLRRLDSTETANGFGNRILWVCARRSKTLPFGGGSIDYGGLLRRLQEATAFARQMGVTRVKFDDCAARLWEQVYGELSEGRPGLLGSMTSRAEAHVVRLALIYALLDCADHIRIEHLRAALAVWNYCAASARFIWGDAIGDPTADEILRELRAAGSDGTTRTNIRDLFARNRTAQEIDRALGVLASMGLASSKTEDSGGRPVTRWVAV